MKKPVKKRKPKSSCATCEKVRKYLKKVIGLAPKRKS